MSRADSLKAKALKVFLRDRGLAGYEIPERFEFVASLPLTSVGKVDKKAVRQRLGAG